MQMKKQISVKAFIITITFVVLLFGGIIMALFFRGASMSTVKGDGINLEFGDSMTGFRLENSNGEILEQLPESNKYSVVFYLSDSCGSCMETI